VTNPNWEPRRLLAVAVELPVEATGTRGRILLAGLKLFADLGFHGTSIRRIATEVGINSATLYAHFPAKEQILAELVHIGHEELFLRMSAALEAAGDDPADRVVALVKAQVLAHTDFPLLAMVANNELHALSAELAAPALKHREAARELLYTELRRGAFPVANPTLAGIAIGSMGVRVASWFGPDQPVTRGEVADTFASYALKILGAER